MFRRRYVKHHKHFNVFLDGLGISPKRSTIKIAVHFDTNDLWRRYPNKITPTLGFSFQYFEKPRVDTHGEIDIVDHRIRVFTGRWNANLPASVCGNYRYYELANPDCVEEIVALFKLMFPVPA